MPTAQGAQAVAQFALFPGAQGDGLGQVLHAQTIRYVIKHLQDQRLWIVMFQGDPHLAPTPQRQAAGHLPAQAWRGAAFQPASIEQGQQEQRQEQAPGDGMQGGRHVELQGHGRPEGDVQAQQHGKPGQQQASRSHGHVTGVVPALGRATGSAPDPPPGLRYPAPGRCVPDGATLPAHSS